MIVAYIFVTILCSASSLPFRESSNSASDLKVHSKRNVHFQRRNGDEYNAQPFGSDSLLEELTDRDEVKNKIGSSNWRDVFVPRNLWPLSCKPNCLSDYNLDASVEDNAARQTDDDIPLHLSADKDLIKFLKWTMRQLDSLNSYNASGNYFPSLNMWKKLNLSGRREQPLYVEEPKYIVVRRELDDMEPRLNSNLAMPFIPPRGRKYIPNLDNLLSRPELFVPNRGKKDIIKDIFKYDDLFFPNRGKKRSSATTTTANKNNKGITPRSIKYDGNYCLWTEDDGRRTYRPFGDYFTRCDDIDSTVISEQVGNLNGLVSASTLHRPSPSSSSSALRADDADGQQDDTDCGAGDVAECQKENDVKINVFDQSVNAQIHQRPHSKGGASIGDSSYRDRRRLLSSAAASLEAGATSFLPLIRPDHMARLQPYPIRNKQWRDYYL